MRCLACSQENFGSLTSECTCSWARELPIKQILQKARLEGRAEGERVRKEAAELAAKEAERRKAQQEALRAEANQWFRSNLTELIKQAEMATTVAGRRKVCLPALYVPFAKEQGLKIHESSGLSWDNRTSTDYILYLDDMFTDPI